MNRRFLFIVRYEGKFWHGPISPLSEIIVKTTKFIRQLVLDGELPYEEFLPQVMLVRKYVFDIRERDKEAFKSQQHTLEVDCALRGEPIPGRSRNRQSYDRRSVKYFVPEGIPLAELKRYRAYGYGIERKGLPIPTYEEYVMIIESKKVVL